MFKKIIFVVLCLFLFMFVKVKVDASSYELLQSYYGELPFAEEYIENSKEYNFNAVTINIDNIYQCIILINETPDNVSMEYVYNIFGEIQYCLIESKTNTSFIIYDFMINEAIEYSLSNNSIWYTNEYAKNKIKIYLNYQYKFYIDNNILYNALDNIVIGNINEEDYVFVGHMLGDNDIIEDVDTAYLNKVIRKDFEIDNSFYFKNHHLTSEYNLYGSCTVVATALLLGYYDTFYNGNIIINTIEGTPYTVSQGCIVYSSTPDISLNITNWGKPIMQSDLNTNYNNVTIGFHNHLVDILRDELGVDVRVNGSTPMDAAALINKYAELNDLTCIDGRYNLLNINMFNILESNRPIILGVTAGNYYFKYFNSSTDIVDKKIVKEIDDPHAVLCYGYQETSIGTFYKCHAGWGSNPTVYTETYLNNAIIGAYAYVDYSGEHVHNYGYRYVDVINNVTIDMCPCQPISTYFTFVSSTDDKDKLSYVSNPSYEIELNHDYSVIETYNDNQHIKKCFFYSGCGKYELENHNFSIKGNYDGTRHYFTCIDCGYTRYENHSLGSVQQFTDSYHRKYCEVCCDYVIYNHTLEFVGTLENHYEVCQVCDEEVHTSEHNYNVSQNNVYYHTYACDCGFSKDQSHTYENNICTICNYSHEHIYSYSKYTDFQHKCTCQTCTYQMYEAHNLIIKGKTALCVSCGWSNNGNIFVPILSDDGKIIYIYENIIKKEEEEL